MGIIQYNYQNRDEMFEGSYLQLNERLLDIKDDLINSLQSCNLCPRNCNVNRLKNEPGFCKSGRLADVSSFNLHFGEERPLVGSRGSGTIFFAGCNLGCEFCQNYSISHLGQGRGVNAQKLADIMLFLQKQGALNINFVTPTHVCAQIIEALVLAIDKGLHLPLVYNCGGYEKVSTLKRVEGVFDIYMPDAKFSDEHYSREFAQAEDYWQVCQEALLEMHRQVGDLITDGIGVAQRGLLIHHLVLPKRVAGSFKILDFIAQQLSKDSYVNIMEQYYPCYNANNYKELSRQISLGEYNEVVDYARKTGLHIGYLRNI